MTVPRLPAVKILPQISDSSQTASGCGSIGGSAEQAIGGGAGGDFTPGSRCGSIGGSTKRAIEGDAGCDFTPGSRWGSMGGSAERAIEVGVGGGVLN